MLVTRPTQNRRRHPRKLPPASKLKPRKLPPVRKLKLRKLPPPNKPNLTRGVPQEKLTLKRALKPNVSLATTQHTRRASRLRSTQNGVTSHLMRPSLTT